MMYVSPNALCLVSDRQSHPLTEAIVPCHADIPEMEGSFDQPAVPTRLVSTKLARAYACNGSGEWELEGLLTKFKQIGVSISAGSLRNRYVPAMNRED